MRVDRYSGQHSISDSLAIAHFEEAVFNVAAHRPLAGEALGRALDKRPDFIAAHALSLGVTLVTNNEREFRRVPGLTVVNWASDE